MPKDTFLLDIGQEIRRIRKSLKLTQTDIGRKIKKTAPTISKIENGKHPLDLLTVRKVAKALGVTVVDLVFKTEPR
jgi:transcriptional regulator with XRE-family HTH domain